MKFGKKLFSSLVVAALSVSMVSTGAFAASSTENTTGYGKLIGAISMNYSLGDFYLTTTVEKNNDNAYLTGKVEWQNKLGQTTGTVTFEPSKRGEKKLFEFWTFYGSLPHQAFGTHGVQGGNTHQSAAAFTFTVL
ncbi:hypothetical protein A7K91_00815 [Paenibacillus oryzae]|uniref:Uncharacterized protein n=2 Tax=Paenibacillus oryzae TaxID=1844972 RepID=A0A1A5YA64_9BACL|nr:hypothetical protein A7K91_00815 [Paenibacillus oryzae]